MHVSSTPTAPAAPVSPAPQPAARRRLRAAVALLNLSEGVASNGFLPPDERASALSEATRHLRAAWRFLTEWTLEAGPSADSTRAAEHLGEVNRRLPLVASELRALAGAPISFDGEAT